MKSGKISFLIKLAILILVVYGTITLVTMRSEISKKEEEAAMLTAAITATENENARTQEDIDALDTNEGIESIARDELGLVGAGEIVFQDVGN